MFSALERGINFLKKGNEPKLTRAENAAAYLQAKGKTPEQCAQEPKIFETLERSAFDLHRTTPGDFTKVEAVIRNA